MTCGNTEIRKKKFHRHKNPIFKKDLGIDSIIISSKISSDEKNINTLLVTWMMIIKLSHYT